MNNQVEKEENLRYLLETDPMKFLKECTIYIEKNDPQYICKYVQLSILEKRKSPLENVEKLFLKLNHNKYKDLNIDILDSINKQNQPINNISDIKNELKSISLNVVKTIQKIDNPGLLELAKSLSKNIREDRNLRYKYNFKNNQELLNCIETFQTEVYSLSEQICIKLKPKYFIHILLGHIEKYEIHRKGEMVKFSNINDWNELLLLIKKVILFLKDEIIYHYNNYDKNYDNKSFNYNGIFYGIHLNQKGDIKTFYERKNKC
ncbi:hypothetical protein [Polaribacter ponticola]|uniref:Uncharacterized protein n=1 Tax=Polaribacter ponticola TaxID=2978475 RepID=A0ABT5S6T7_9FLAO|nr:hypothetical protein [Polaribacter sp. MSW5]MDD7913810.1 hypothetical protein [Polaribacter sp. MSW5]